MGLADVRHLEMKFDTTTGDVLRRATDRGGDKPGGVASNYWQLVNTSWGVTRDAQAASCAGIGIAPILLTV